MQADLRLGRWQEALADVAEVDALIVDAPYSSRTHAGMRIGVMKGVDPRPSARKYDRQTVAYDHWTPEDVDEFVAAWSPRTKGWIVSVTDHVLGPAWERAYQAAGLYTFHPLPFLEMGKQPRMSGDGPASWSCWIYVARPKQRRFQSWGSLPGAYVAPESVVGTRGDRYVKGGKPLWLMRALIRDYSRPGDLICDPCAGGATTLLAALQEGRRAIGAEMDPAHYEIGRKRLSRGFTAPLFVEGARPPAVQLDLTGDDHEP
jgi:site-specific DNA-methyltransferase (adenine-specific)